MAANHDQVAVLRLGQGMDFLARLAVVEVAVVLVQLRVLGDQPLKALFGLVELLLLQLRKIHRHVAAERHRHRFDDVYQRQFGAVGLGAFTGAVDHGVAFVGQVYGDQDMFVGHVGCSCRWRLIMSMALFQSLGSSLGHTFIK